MLTGAHMVLYSSNVEADRAFFGEVLKLPSVDGGGGFLIYALPPAELGVHEGEANGQLTLPGGASSASTSRAMPGRRGTGHEARNAVSKGIGT